MSDRKNRPGKTFATFLCCVFAMPTCTYLIPGISAADMTQAVTAGVFLGVIYLVLRPIARLITLPLGCLTLGLIHMALDVGLIYLCDRFIEGFTVSGVDSAIFASLLVNTLIAIMGGFR